MGESKDWLHAVTFLIDKDSKIKLRTPYLGNKRKHFHNYYNFAQFPIIRNLRSTRMFKGNDPFNDTLFYTY